jgi:nitroreductase
MSTADAAALEFLFRRRSIRVFRPGPIPDDRVRRLLEAAMAAPSAVAKDPWRFVVVRERDTLARLAAALPNGQMLATAGLGIAVAGDLDAAHDRQLSYLLQDCSAAIENLLLAATALGLGACWLGVHPREDRMRRVRDMLGLPEALVPVSLVALGWPGEDKEARTRFNPDFVRYERWCAGELRSRLTASSP